VSVWRHLRAIGLLPGMALIVIPGIIIWSSGGVDVGWELPLGAALGTVLVGALLIGLGLALMVRTVSLFARVGQGTLAPWDPTIRLVVLGPYRHVRNPMISGVLAVLLGEAVMLGSPPLAIWAGAFFTLNAIFIPLFEEPLLVRRFGADYEAYRAEVPRWIPRLRPWDLESHG
jgi:protein-S-isoprenylcysteine O-methyltransferase Ste14